MSNIDYEAFNEMVRRAGVKPHLLETAMKFVKEYEEAKSPEQPVDLESNQQEYYRRGWKDAEDHYAEYEGKPTGQPVGITDEEQLGFLSEDILKMLADHVHNCQSPLRTKLCALIRPYMATNVRESGTQDE